MPLTPLGIGVTVPPSHPVLHHDVLVLGGGNAGVSLAAHLRRRGVDDVAVVEPRREHRYRPLLSYVAGGLASSRSLLRPQRRVVPRGVTWLPEEVADIDPRAGVVRLGSGLRVTYGDLVVAVGTEPDWDAWPGSRAAYDAGLAASSYLEASAERAWERMAGLEEGTVVFTLPPPPTSCGPTALKPLLMACDHWRRRGVLGAVRPVLLTAERPTGVGELDPYVQEALDDFGVEVVEGVRHVEVDVARRRVCAGDRAFDVAFVHLVPPYRVPDVVRRSGLAGDGPGGLVDNDPRTFRHRVFHDVWALGDCATTLNLHSGAALREQAPVLADNLRDARHDRDATLHEDTGYSAAPVTVSRGRLCFAEFGADGSRQGSVPYVDLFRPRRSTWLLDRYVLPRVYWRGILRGRL